MKIHADKIDRAPAHGLRVAELWRILAAVPPAWLADVTEVRLSNALRRPDFACFNRYDGTLTVYSRGRTSGKLIAPIFTELAAYALGIPHRWGHRLSAADTHRLQLLVQSLTEQFTAPPKQRPPVNAGLVDWLLTCPEKDFFVPIASGSTDTL